MEYPKIKAKNGCQCKEHQWYTTFNRYPNRQIKRGKKLGVWKIFPDSSSHWRSLLGGGKIVRGREVQMPDFSLWQGNDQSRAGAWFFRDWSTRKRKASLPSGKANL